MLVHTPMRRSAREIRDVKEIRAVVGECQTVRLGLLDEEGIFIVPLNFGFEWLDDEAGEDVSLVLYVHSAQEGRKVRALDALAMGDGKLAIELDLEDGLLPSEDPNKCSYAYRSIMGTATVSKLQGVEEKSHALDLLMWHHTKREWPGYSAPVMSHTNLYRLEVDYLTCKKNG